MAKVQVEPLTMAWVILLDLAHEITRCPLPLLQDWGCHSQKGQVESIYGHNLCNNL